MISVFYFDDFNCKHFITLDNTRDLDFLKERFERVYVL